MRPPSGEADEPDLYAVLGVSTGADADEIARAFRRGALTGHPDRGGDPAVFRDLQRARETLLDPVRRAAYDRRRAATTDPEPSGSDPTRGRGSAPRPEAAEPFAWSSGAGPSRARASAPQQGTTDPFDWSPGARKDSDGRGESTGRAGFRVHDAPSPASDAERSWRRADRFAWWGTEDRPHPRRRRRWRGAARDRDHDREG
ncbi:J domain-containing protein [Streptomyces sp. ST2-7A]|uniref:J domain-containing protein n=1 Tax=Streptomyces sp. ST2-7A TaxID=2907214 RepID=UPI001F472ACB|nr:J domain-containing protein [Streptomyces sp. ST2-7A]MCE7080902.1 DnaJ domain-containing protein [Streptomyces sp. ST2-7A]